MINFLTSFISSTYTKLANDDTTVSSPPPIQENNSVVHDVIGATLAPTITIPTRTNQNVTHPPVLYLLRKVSSALQG